MRALKIHPTSQDASAKRGGAGPMGTRGSSVGILFIFILWMGRPVMALAQSDVPPFKVAPWNGHKAAASLTFDDGDDSHLDVAIPEMDKRKMPGTFYLIVNKLSRKDEWRKILERGHEIGNHSLDHLHAKDLTAAQAHSQVVGARNVLQKTFGVPVESFCYPFSEVTPELKKCAGENHLLVRGGEGNYFMSPTVEPDWANIPAEVTRTALPFSAYQAWMDQDLKKGDWFVFMVHGLENSKGWEPISRGVFVQILDYLQSHDFWVGTFLQVGAYFRAQKIFEGAPGKAVEGGKRWTWQVPPHFPPKVSLKARLAGPAAGEWLQGGEKLAADAQGIYSISFNKGELVWRTGPKI